MSSPSYYRQLFKASFYPSRFKTQVNEDWSTACESCIDPCFFDGVTMTEDNSALLNPDNCMDYSVGIPTCEGDAITLKESEPIDSIPE